LARYVILILVFILGLAGCRLPQAATPPGAGEGTAPQAAQPIAGPYRVLFDGSHGEMAGNADWVIGASMPDPRGENPAPDDESDWTGAISAWGVALQRTGRYRLMTLPRDGRIAYGDGAGPLDLANFDVFVVPEPNVRFTAAEKTAIVTFVKNGGGLFMIADHDGSDRNRDGYDSPRIWNDLMRDNGVADNSFGFSFDIRDIGRDDPRGIPAGAANDPIIRGPFGTVKGSIIRDGTTATLDPRANPDVHGLLYRSGAEVGGTSGVFFLAGTYGQGRVAAWGDSSPVDDGTGATHDQLYDGWNDAGGSNAALALNATEWLAQGTPAGQPTAAAATTAAVNAPAATGQLVANGDFEHGLDGWSASDGVRVSDGRAHAGQRSAMLCGINNCAASLRQTLTLPANAKTATLSYAALIATQETSHAFDFLTIELRDPSGQTLAVVERLSDGDAAGEWLTNTFDMSAYAGRTVELVFSATSGRISPTTFYLDDIRMEF
jgi:hypothetical protein